MTKYVILTEELQWKNIPLEWEDIKGKCLIFDKDMDDWDNGIKRDGTIVKHLGNEYDKCIIINITEYHPLTDCNGIIIKDD